MKTVLKNRFHIRMVRHIISLVICHCCFLIDDCSQLKCRWPILTSFTGNSVQNSLLELKMMIFLVNRLDDIIHRPMGALPPYEEQKDDSSHLVVVESNQLSTSCSPWPERALSSSVVIGWVADAMMSSILKSDFISIRLMVQGTSLERGGRENYQKTEGGGGSRLSPRDRNMALTVPVPCVKPPYTETM